LLILSEFVGRMISGTTESRKPELMGWMDRIVQAQKRRYDPDRGSFKELDKF
jgi:hypothetical protein